MILSRTFAGISLILIATSACGRSAPEIRTIEMTESARWRAFEDSIATGGGLIYDFIIDSRGRITAIDFQGHRLLHYQPDGSFLGSLGREGAGPFELRYPQEIEIQGDTVYVHDNGNNRVLVIGPRDELLRMVTLNPPRVIPTSFTVGPGGWMFGATRGYTPDGLCVCWAPDGRQKTVIGELEHEATMLFDGELVKEMALKREIAPFLRNWATAIATSDGNVILVFFEYARAIKYTRDGSILWDRALDLLEYNAMFEAYVEANRHSVRGELLRLWRDTVADDSGGAWLLSGVESPLTIYHLDSEGDLSERLIGPDFPANRIFPHHGDMWAYHVSSETFIRLRSIPEP